MPLTSLNAISPIDGRYNNKTTALKDYFSEYALIRYRVIVELRWLQQLAENPGISEVPVLSDSANAFIEALIKDFSEADAQDIKDKEAVTNHDVKAVEYFIKERLAENTELKASMEFVHFACTSEDINNLAYALTIRDALEEVWLPALRVLLEKLRGLSQETADTPMLSRTHGQPATPTTLGKELAVFVFRLQRQLSRIDSQAILGKFSGATGTYAAHLVAAPDVDWPEQSKGFVESLGLTHNPLTTQIESHDWQAELYQKMGHVNRILHNFATDIWTYISINYFKQIPVKGATGSSTMPHKINPIRFENAEANLEMSLAVLDSLAATLVTSRLQRDLTDSSAQRNIGVGFGHSLLAIDNLTKGLDELAVNEAALLTDLLENWEVLGEAIQSAIRADVARGESEIKDPYALLKELTRGKRITDEDLKTFVNGLDISNATKERLLVLKPQTYLGLAAELAKLVAN